MKQAKGLWNNKEKETEMATVGTRLKTKYPKHGRRNILKWYEGKVIKVATGPNGPYVTIQAGNKIRSLLESKMIEPVFSWDTLGKYHKEDKTVAVI
jgi:hypothetical protein